MIAMGISTKQCPYCKNPINRKTVSKEHIIPTCANGSNDFRNKIWVCGTCNNLLKKNKVFAAKALKHKTVTDSIGRIYIPDDKARRDYIAGIRGTIMQLVLADDPLL
jgi:hypothetical protein